MDTRRLRARCHQSRPRFKKAHHHRIHDRRGSRRLRHSPHHEPDLGHQYTNDGASIPLREKRASHPGEPTDQKAEHAWHVSVSDTDRGPFGALCGRPTGFGTGYKPDLAIHHFRAAEGSIGEEEEGQTPGRVFPGCDWEATGDKHHIPLHHDQE